MLDKHKFILYPSPGEKVEKQIKQSKDLELSAKSF